MKLNKILLTSLVIGSLAFSGLVHGAAPVLGCTNRQASNYDSLADTDDGSCIIRNGNGDPNKVPQVFDGLTGYQLPIVKCDLHGILFDRCFDVSATDYFKSRLHPIGITILPKRGTFGDFAFGNN